MWTWRSFSVAASEGTTERRDNGSTAGNDCQSTTSCLEYFVIQKRKPFARIALPLPMGSALEQFVISCQFPASASSCSAPPHLLWKLSFFIVSCNGTLACSNPNGRRAKKKNTTLSGINMGGGGTPCGACKFLRRKCAKSCVFAPYFSSDEMGTRNFCTIHKVFGASNFSKLLMDLPVEKRYDAVVSVLYEAEARLQEPVYGCVSHIYALQQQVAHLKEKLSASYAQVAACGSSDGALLGLEYGYGIQSEMPSLISNSNSSSRYDKQHFSAWGDLQHIASKDVQMNNYNGKARKDEGSWSSTFSMCMQGNNSMSSNHALSTSQETDVVQDADRLSEQRRPISDDDRDLQDLVLAVLRRNSSTCVDTGF